MKPVNHCSFNPSFSSMPAPGVMNVNTSAACGTFDPNRGCDPYGFVRKESLPGCRLWGFQFGTQVADTHLPFGTYQAVPSTRTSLGKLPATVFTGIHPCQLFMRKVCPSETLIVTTFQTLAGKFRQTTSSPLPLFWLINLNPKPFSKSFSFIEMVLNFVQFVKRCFSAIVDGSAEKALCKLPRLNGLDTPLNAGEKVVAAEAWAALWEWVHQEGYI